MIDQDARALAIAAARAADAAHAADLMVLHVGDVLNDLAEWTLEMHGEVVMVPAQRMPSSTGIAATYRY